MKTRHIPVFGIFAVILALFANCPEPDNGRGESGSHAHDWGDWGATTLEGTEQRTCKDDPSHIEHRLTGTDRFTFTSATSTSYSVKKGELTRGNVVIPAYYRPNTDGDHLVSRGYLPVTKIDANAFYECGGIDSINIPETITTIGNSAFYDCGFDSLTIPASVTSIGSRAFYNCTNIDSVTIPSSVTEIGSGAFNYWNDYQIICVPFDDERAADTAWDESWRSGCGALIIGNRVDGGTAGLAYELINNGTAYRVSKGRVTSGEVRIPICYRPNAQSQYKPVREIGRMRTDSETEFDFGAFQGTFITSVTIPASVTSIGASAFRGCNGLTSVTIPAGVTTIGSAAFADCNGLTRVTISANLTSTGLVFWNCTSLTNVTFSEGVTSIGASMFPGCTRLTSVTIPESVTTIGGGAFSGCTGLTSVTIPAGVTSIGGGAFRDCTGLTEITIPAGVTTIGGGAFSGCTGLTEITIPASVTSIGENRYENWVSYENAFAGCTGLTSITVAANNPNYASEGGILYNKAKTELIASSARGNVTIPAGVTTIGGGAFRGCTGLTSITIPASVTSIDTDAAFYGCSGLTSITLPAGLRSIDGNMFRDCTSLASITIPASVTYIGGWAFYGWTSSQTINILGFANQLLVDGTWGVEWREGCAAIINCLGG